MDLGEEAFRSSHLQVNALLYFHIARWSFLGCGFATQTLSTYRVSSRWTKSPDGSYYMVFNAHRRWLQMSWKQRCSLPLPSFGPEISTIAFMCTWCSVHGYIPFHCHRVVTAILSAVSLLQVHFVARGFITGTLRHLPFRQGDTLPTNHEWRLVDEDDEWRVCKSYMMYIQGAWPILIHVLRHHTPWMEQSIGDLHCMFDTYNPLLNTLANNLKLTMPISLSEALKRWVSNSGHGKGGASY